MEKLYYFENEFDDGEYPSEAWRTANWLLGTVKNLVPAAIIHKEVKNGTTRSSFYGSFLQYL